MLVDGLLGGLCSFGFGVYGSCCRGLVVSQSELLVVEGRLKQMQILIFEFCVAAMQWRLQTLALSQAMDSSVDSGGYRLDSSQTAEIELRSTSKKGYKEGNHDAIVSSTYVKGFSKIDASVIANTIIDYL